MIYKITVRKKIPEFDVIGRNVRTQIEELGIKGVERVRFASAYYLKSESMTPENIDMLAGQLLSDNVTESYTTETYDVAHEVGRNGDDHIIEVSLNHGVTDATAAQVMKAIAQLGMDCQAAKLVRIYTITGNATDDEIAQIGRRILYNPVVEHTVQPGDKPFVDIRESEPDMEILPLANMTDDELMALSRNRLWLNLLEMQTIREYYRHSDRPATDVEIETLAQTWSEHCSHKVFRANVYVDGELQVPFIKRLKGVTEDLNRDWCWSVFIDDSGVIEFDDDWGVCFKVETHNKPSGIEPFGGAHTGIGGVIRDIMATGLGGKPIANTNVLCFAPPETPWDKIPTGLLHPKRVMRQVVAGIMDYGNKMGIPTVNGSICFSDRFLGLPLVYAGCLGMIEREIVAKGRPEPGDRVILMGGLTGRDGIHGATFSSGELTKESEHVSAQSVQIGHPLVEKKVLDALNDIKNERLLRAISDCGGGGLSSAIGEMANPDGVEVDLAKIPLKYPLPYISDYWISESQERMLIAAPPENFERIKAICHRHDVDVADIGRFTDNRRLVLRFKNKTVADLEMEFLHNGCPRREFHLASPEPPPPEEKFVPEPSGEQLAEYILQTLEHLDVCSKENVARIYDHEVQAKTVIKPFMGQLQRSPSDGAVLKPLYNNERGVVIANGINVRYGLIDPRRMGRSVVDEAVRQIVAIGGNPDRIAILDNFSMPSPELDKTIMDLHLTVTGLCEAARHYGTPFISGKDSFYNQYQAEDGTLICVPPTLLVSSICVIDDIRNAIPSFLHKAGNRLYLLGMTKDELMMSCYFRQTGQSGTDIPDVDLETNSEMYRRYYSAARENLIRAAHDCSDGGLAVTAAEMVIGGSFGIEIDLQGVQYEGRRRDDFMLFSESNGRLLVEVDEANAARFEEIFDGMPMAHIGRVTDIGRLVITKGGRTLVDLSGETLYKRWAAPVAAVI